MPTLKQARWPWRSHPTTSSFARRLQISYGEFPAASCSNPNSVRMRCVARTTSGWVNSRGRGDSTCNSQRIPPGRPDNTRTRSASCTASDTSCVTRITVRGRSCSNPTNSRASATASNSPTTKTVHPAAGCPRARPTPGPTPPADASPTTDAGNSRRTPPTRQDAASPEAVRSPPPKPIVDPRPARCSGTPFATAAVPILGAPCELARPARSNPPSAAKLPR